jgi:aspartyl-tRNA(Asn)/glutamyl-tRNA(Gln) amidotransferase subunit B
VLEPVIGLEIHAQLRTETKIFCACRNAFGAPPNTDTCPVCLGLPGSLPVLNQRAVELAVRAALALNCTVHPRSVFARKNYFYPDLPKGYQITQYDAPLATGGWIAMPGSGGEKRIGVTRVHLEEDAGKSLHHGFADSDRFTYLDFNRAGVPLIEIVARIRQIVVSIGVNDGNMEEGNLRCDANVSVRQAGTAGFGAKTEIKNVNSFRYVQKAIEFEIARQSKAVAAGKPLAQETRLWDVDRGETVAMRSKEEAHDYRYFPEPDLPPLHIDAAWIANIRAALPELADARAARLASAYGLSAYDADVLVRLMDGAADYFERTVAAGAPAKAASNWIQGEVRRKLKEAGASTLTEAAIAPQALADLIGIVERGEIGSAAARSVFETMWTTGKPAADIVQAEGLGRIDDAAALARVVADVVAAHPAEVEQVRRGRNNVLGFLIGVALKATGGKADPKTLAELVRQAVDGDPKSRV